MNTLTMESPLTMQYRAHVHWFSYVRPAIFAIFTLPAFMLFLSDALLMKVFMAPFIFYGIKAILRIFENYHISIIVGNKKISVTTGLFSTQTVDILLSKAEGLIITQSFLGKLLNYGTIHIDTGGFSQTVTVSNPNGLRQAILNEQSNL